MLVMCCSSLNRYIFKFYTQDKFHYPMDECIQGLIDEFKFFKIPLDTIEDCCYAEFHVEYENNLNTSKLAREKRPNRVSTISHVRSISNQVKPTNFSRKFSKKFPFVESKSFICLTLLCALLNVLAIVLETLPGKIRKDKREKLGKTFSREFLIFDVICVVILSSDLLINFARSPCKKHFFCNVPNIMYLLSLAPAYVYWILILILGFQNLPSRLVDSFEAVRVFRIVKIANSSSRLRETVGQIVAAARGLGMILCIWIIAVVVLSVLLYHVDTSCSNVLNGMWYFIVTMTSLG